MSKYYIGLDIGTESVGWAVTDTQYNIMFTRFDSMFRGNRFYPVWGKIAYPRIDKKSDLGEEILRGLFCCRRV